jgi:hypothetical protein
VLVPVLVFPVCDTPRSPKSIALTASRNREMGKEHERNRTISSSMSDSFHKDKSAIHYGTQEVIMCKIDIKTVQHP